MNNIKRLRVKNNITQAELAEKLGIKRPSVANWERGKTFPKTEFLPTLASIFKCKIDDLFQN